MGYLDALEAGSQLDSYRIEWPVARSGMASIYRAVDTRDNRTVALKDAWAKIEKRGGQASASGGSRK